MGWSTPTDGRRWKWARRLRRRRGRQMGWSTPTDGPLRNSPPRRRSAAQGRRCSERNRSDGRCIQQTLQRGARAGSWAVRCRCQRVLPPGNRRQTAHRGSPSRPPCGKGPASTRGRWRYAGAARPDSCRLHRLTTRQDCRRRRIDRVEGGRIHRGGVVQMRRTNRH